MKNRKMRSVCTCIAAMFMLVGCGTAKVPEVVDVTSLVLSEEGQVTSYLVDVFDKDYYDLAELKTMALEDAADYNAERQSGEAIPLEVEKVEALQDGSGKVVVVHKYDSADTYRDYNDTQLFYGTVSEAVKQGINLDIVMKNVKGDTQISKEELLQTPDRYLVVTDEKAVIYCPGKVTHVSEGAVYGSDGTVDTNAAEGTTVILLK